jgi:hypothetical protein
MMPKPRCRCASSHATPQRTRHSFTQAPRFIVLVIFSHAYY